jgi:periplasmic glucans biosynthesis protein
MTGLTRRSTLALLLGGGSASLSPLAAAAASWPSEASLGPAHPFSFDRLKARAAALAARPYQPPPEPPARVLDGLDSESFGKALYRPGAALWGDTPGDQSVRFFPLSRGFHRPVEINIVAGDQARTVKYARSLFDRPPASPALALPGFGGFKVMNADRVTDWMAYLGAAYFRSADPANQFGLSARGVAVDTATAGPEEFPAFTAFWIEHDPAGLVVHALLDGPSLAGAYRIAHHRSPAGLVQDIDVQLNFRTSVKRLGLAPLTSMYWYGRGDHGGDDWRPQVHDSDGLSIWTGAGERIWRPLANPRRVTVNAFQDRSPRGFGLMQRDRNFEDYQDDGVFYERRPSAWVEPLGDWGAGSVQLAELPTTGETEDNVVAFWTPAAAATAGQSLAYRYRLHWAKEEPGVFGVARVVATWAGRGGKPGRRRFVVDFAGGALMALDRQSGVEALVDVKPGAPFEVTASPVAGQNRWRLMFDIDTPAGATVDLRAYLRKGAQALSETWIDQVAGA